MRTNSAGSATTAATPIITPPRAVFRAFSGTSVLASASSLRMNCESWRSASEISVDAGRVSFLTSRRLVLVLS